MTKTIKEKAKEYADSIVQRDELRKYCEEDFTYGAEWMRKQMIKEACEWLNLWYNEGTRSCMVKEDIDNFKQAMEELWKNLKQ